MITLPEETLHYVQSCSDISVHTAIFQYRARCISSQAMKPNTNTMPGFATHHVTSDPGKLMF